MRPPAKAGSLSGPMLRAALIASLLALLPACKSAETQHADGAQESGDAGAAAVKEVVLPAPHELAAEPIAVAYVRDPAGILDVAGLMVPGVPPASGVIELLLGTQMPAELAHTIAPMIATRTPWVAVHVAGEDVVHLPLDPARVADAEAALAALPPAGEFGGRQLPAPALSIKAIMGGGGELSDGEGGGGDALPARLAWVNAEGRALTLALTEQGLVTGREALRAYSKKGLWISASREKIAEYSPGFPYARVTVEGAGLDDLSITTIAEPQQGLPSSPELAPGALTNLHAHAPLALAASGRWAKHEAAVKQMSREITRQVDNAGFAAKMLLDPLAQQAIAVLKSWNGRAFVGLGPAGHLSLGLGADDPIKAGQGLTRLIGAVSDNLELARMFVSDVPKIAIRKSGDVHVVTVAGAKKMMPAEAQPFLDERGNLKVALAASARGGAVFGVVGPRAEEELAAWSKAIEAAPAATESLADLVAVTVALAPAQVQEILAIVDPRDPKALIKAGAGVSAGRAPTQVILRQEADRYVVTSKGPAGTLPPARQGRAAGG